MTALCATTLVLLAMVALACGDAAPQGGGCPQTLGRDALESCLRAELGVPSDAPLRESLAFSNPLLARVARGHGELPDSLSLASVTSGPALLTAAKRGERGAASLVLRLYQPSNASLPLEIATSAPRLAPTSTMLVPRLVTALEALAPEDEAHVADVRGDASGFRVTALHALTTIELDEPD